MFLADLQFLLKTEDQDEETCAWECDSKNGMTKWEQVKSTCTRAFWNQVKKNVRKIHSNETQGEIIKR